MAKELYTVAKTQYDDYLDKLTNGHYRLSEIAENITVKGAALIALYALSELEGNDARKAAILLLLEDAYDEDITAPTISSGIASEAAQEDSKAVTAGANTITFPLALSSADYVLLLTCYDSSGNNMSYRVYDKTATGFKIYVAANGFVDYRATIE
jgi:hypothetical protein